MVIFQNKLWKCQMSSSYSRGYKIIIFLYVEIYKTLFWKGPKIYVGLTGCDCALIYPSSFFMFMSKICNHRASFRYFSFLADVNLANYSLFSNIVQSVFLSEQFKNVLKWYSFHILDYIYYSIRCALICRYLTKGSKSIRNILMLISMNAHLLPFVRYGQIEPIFYMLKTLLVLSSIFL